jgi:hypothetical protein
MTTQSVRAEHPAVFRAARLGASGGVPHANPRSRWRNSIEWPAASVCSQPLLSVFPEGQPGQSGAVYQARLRRGGRLGAGDHMNDTPDALSVLLEAATDPQTYELSWDSAAGELYLRHVLQPENSQRTDGATGQHVLSAGRSAI